MLEDRQYSTRSAQRGFTLIELMIVIAILAILLSFAIPAYQDYTIRSRVSEGLALAGAAKTAVTETCMSDPTVAPDNARSGYSFSGSEYVTSITIQNTCARPWIVIRTRNTGASPDVVLSLDGYLDLGSGSVRWNCHHVSGQEEHIPQSCRDGHWFP